MRQKVRIDEIYVNEGKRDVKGDYFRPVKIVSSDLQVPHWRNVYFPDDPSLKWKPGDVVEIDTKEDGKWHNFFPVGWATKKPEPKVVAEPKVDIQEAMKRIRDLEAEVSRLKEKENADFMNLDGKFEPLWSAIRGIRSQLAPKEPEKPKSEEKTPSWGEI